MVAKKLLFQGDTEAIAKIIFLEQQSKSWTEKIIHSVVENNKKDD
jgi:hypothetical protein